MRRRYLYPIALFAVLAIVGAGLYLSNREAEGVPVTVTLMIFSGRPDPTWELSSPGEVSRLYELLDNLPVAENPLWESRLGYRGFTLEPVLDESTNTEGRIVVWKGIIEFEHDGAFIHYADVNGLESFLLEMARARGFADLVSSPSIQTFEDCVKAGHPVLESYPRQCAMPDGRTFVEDVGTGESTPPPQLPNPASVFCEQNGGRVEMRTDAAGNQYGVCIFPDGSECEEWAFFRRECHGLPASCGNGFCEGGEGGWCPPCTYLALPCGAPCESGTCPTDCADSKFSFRVSDCLRTGAKTPEAIEVSVMGQTIFVSHRLNYVCCANVILDYEIAEDSPPVVKIVERNIGEVCRCMCEYDVQARVGPLKPGTYRIEVWGVEYENMPASLLFAGEWTIAGSDFCGSSTLGHCFSDADCVRGGCSGQVCQSRFEKTRITTCEFRECYDAERYGYGCTCVEGKCLWRPISLFTIV